MPPDDSTGEIRPVGRMNTMYTTERCTIYTYIYTYDGWTYVATAWTADMDATHALDSILRTEVVSYSNSS